jgi:hypothetical protein
MTGPLIFESFTSQSSNDLSGSGDSGMYRPGLHFARLVHAVHTVFGGAIGSNTYLQIGTAAYSCLWASVYLAAVVILNGHYMACGTYSITTGMPRGGSLACSYAILPSAQYLRRLSSALQEVYSAWPLYTQPIWGIDMAAMSSSTFENRNLLPSYHSLRSCKPHGLQITLKLINLYSENMSSRDCITLLVSISRLITGDSIRCPHTAI